MTAKTHYDTLKVTQDAPEEVIVAAYKALARIYHPDRNSNDVAAMATMQNINMSYTILSDPQKRADHDLWISQQERRSGRMGDAASRRPMTEEKDKKVRAEKSLAEATKWKAWADRTAQEAKEAQTRADKALADLAKAKPEDRAKWEAWANKTAQEAKEAKDRADKASDQASKSVVDALSAAADANAEDKIR